VVAVAIGGGMVAVPVGGGGGFLLGHGGGGGGGGGLRVCLWLRMDWNLEMIRVSVRIYPAEAAP
jgi:hypothetical protein